MKKEWTKPELEVLDVKKTLMEFLDGATLDAIYVAGDRSDFS